MKARYKVFRKVGSMDPRYKKVLEKGKPVHQKGDDFFVKHPPMDLSRRAKIFSPFDALKGFGDELSRTEDISEGFDYTESNVELPEEP